MAAVKEKVLFKPFRAKNYPKKSIIQVNKLNFSFTLMQYIAEWNLIIVHTHIHPVRYLTMHAHDVIFQLLRSKFQMERWPENS